MIQVLERFHKIMEYVAETPEIPKGVSELARMLGISAPACGNIVRTMVELGYLESVGHRQGYILGPSPYVLSRKGAYRRHLLEAAAPVIEALVKDINEMLVLVTESSGKRTELMRVEPDCMVQVKSPPSESLGNLLHSATGVIILAHKSEQEFRDYWESSQDQGTGLLRCDEAKGAWQKCAEIRKAGIFISEPHVSKGDDELNKSCTLALPIYEDGQLVGTLGSRVPMFRFKGARRKQVLGKLKDATDKIGRCLGMRGE